MGTKMSDDYLFDGSGTPDPDIERLERMLGRLRSTASAPPIAIDGERRTANDERPYLGARFYVPALAAAAAIALMVGLTWTNAALAPSPADATAGKASWEVSVLIGTPRIGASVLVGDGRIAVGQTLTTDEGSRAKMAVSDIGQVTVDERTRVQLVETRDGHHRLALERGTLHAAIAAPPGQFVVSTPSATATDLGCVYSLHVNDDGSGMLTVEAGWVAFEERGRESFVPAGASSRTDRVNGPGTPRYDDTAQAFRDALDDIDNGRDAVRRTASLRFVIQHARGRDAMTLWHLIPRVDGADRGAAIDALAARVPMPGAITREAVLRLDRAVLDRWWDALGLNEASWWRKWKGAYPAAASPPHAAQVQSCPVTSTVRATPPPANNAGSLGDGPWWVNTDRTLWMQSATGPWHAGYNQRNRMIAERIVHLDGHPDGDRLAFLHAGLELPLLHRLDRIRIETVDCVERPGHLDVADGAVREDDDVEADHALDTVSSGLLGVVGVDLLHRLRQRHAVARRVDRRVLDADERDERQSQQHLHRTSGGLRRRPNE
jgi:hypothetical protein